MGFESYTFSLKVGVSPYKSSCCALNVFKTYFIGGVRRCGDKFKLIFELVNLPVIGHFTQPLKSTVLICFVFLHHSSNIDLIISATRCSRCKMRSAMSAEGSCCWKR